MAQNNGCFNVQRLLSSYCCSHSIYLHRDVDGVNGLMRGIGNQCDGLYMGYTTRYNHEAREVTLL